MSGRLRTVPILAYHRISDPKDDHVPTVAPESFDAQLKFLARYGYRVWDLPQLCDAWERGGAVPARSVVITFDDGYEETCTVAAPILRRVGFRATVFVTPNEIGQPGFMSWEQLRTVAEDGLTIGSHTLNHTYLPLVDRQQAEQELVESKRVLEQRLQRPVEWLSYPIGGFTEDIQALAKACGYRAACTTNRGRSRLSQDRFSLRRIKMTDRDRHPVLMWAKLSGYYDLFRQIQAPS